jgi:hypothetical protein
MAEVADDSKALPNQPFNGIFIRSFGKGYMLYFPDYDPAGLRIFASEVLPFRDKAELVIPQNFEFLLERFGNRELFLQQQQLLPATHPNEQLQRLSTAVSRTGPPDSGFSMPAAGVHWPHENELRAIAPTERDRLTEPRSCSKHHRTSIRRRAASGGQQGDRKGTDKFRNLRKYGGPRGI